MPTDTPPTDYSSKTKSELLELLMQRDTALADLSQRTAEAAASFNTKADELIAQAQSARALLADRDATISNLRAELATHAAEAARAEELKAARLAERDKALAKGDPPKLLGSVQVYLQDEPSDIVDRARALFAGQIPADRARRFKIDARLILSRDWPLAKRLGTSPPLGAEFDADEIPAQERTDYAAAGAIVAIG